jgi:hypothetical protein
VIECSSRTNTSAGACQNSNNLARPGEIDFGNGRGVGNTELSLCGDFVSYIMFFRKYYHSIMLGRALACPTSVQQYTTITATVQAYAKDERSRNPELDIRNISLLK